MVAKFHFDAVGMEELLTNLDSLDYRLKRASKRALTEGAKVVLKRAKEFVQMGPAQGPLGRYPQRRTGTLFKALKIGRRKSKRDGESVDIGAFGGSAPYAHLVELGHGFHNSKKSADPPPLPGTGL